MDNLLSILLLNSIYAGITTAIVLFVRLALKHAPKIFSYMLWAVVFFRLACPVPINTGFSIIPNLSQLQKTHDVVEDEYSPETMISDLPDNQAVYPTNIEAVDDKESVSPDGSINAEVKPYADETSFRHTISSSVTKLIFAVWATGCVIMLSWYCTSWINIRRKICTATRSGEKNSNIYVSDQINTAFVFGILKPGIYVPTWLDSNQYRLIVKHEQIHLSRGDNIFKLVAFLITSVYWFDPIAWISYHLMCSDMEMSCDEAVISEFGEKIKGGYSKMLLDFGSSRILTPETPFGENAVKARIKHTLTYKKMPAISATVAAFVVLLVFTSCVGTNTGNYNSVESSVDGVLLTTDEISTADKYEDIQPKPEDYTISVGESGAIIEKYHGADSIIRLPNVYEGFPVTQIGNSAFSMQKELQVVIVPNSITSIGDCAFQVSPRLKDVVLPDTLTHIGTQAFFHCTSLKNVNLPEGLSELGSQCFDSCEDLEKIAIPASLKEIPMQSFVYCKNLKNITLSYGVEKIGYMSFAFCEALESIDIPESVWCIDDCAFTHCYSLSKASVPSSVINLGIDIFEYCELLSDDTRPKAVMFDGQLFSHEIKDLVIPDGTTAVSGIGPNSELETVTLPNSVITVEQFTFADCPKLKSVTFGSGLKNINSEAFENCVSLESITLPTGLKRIDSAAFFGCSSMKEISIPSSVEYFGSNIFGECSTALVVICEEGSAAHEYAMNNNIEVKLF